MGFGSYDESEQERQQTDIEDIDEEEAPKEENKHDGEVDFEMMDTESAIEVLHDIKESDEE